MSKTASVLIAAMAIAVMLVGARAEEPAAPPSGPVVQPLQAAPQDTAAPTTPTPAHEMTAADVEAFLDGMIPYALKRGDMAGATVSVVKDGQLLFAKGYGFADLE